MRKIGLLIILVFIISACGEPTPPKRGAVETSSGFTSASPVYLRSSLNCAYPGEEIVFTLTMENGEPFDIELVGTPVIEIELQDTHNTVVRWSEDATYPSIERTLKQGEKRTYEWRWRAQGIDGSMNARVLAEASPPQGNPLHLILPLGVNWITWNIPGGATEHPTCSELR